MNRRLIAATVLFAVLAITAGCTDFLGPREHDEETLNEPAEYDWETSANATITIDSDDEYRAVYTVQGDTFEVYQTDRLNNERPVRISSLRYRYPNGTVVNGSQLDVETSRTATTIQLPADEGQIAYTAESGSKRFGSPPLVEGSHVVVLPENRKVENFLFGQVRPGGYETERVDGRLHIRWEDGPGDDISIYYYIQRDLYIFSGVLVLLIAGLLGGLGYVRWQIRRLRREREEMGLNVDVEDDYGDDPPPGMG